jgi:very-short-patch-repair endonuclease
MTATITRLRRQQVSDAGWHVGTELENKVAWRLHRAGFTPQLVQCQLRIGRYRVDFALPSVKVVIEADGWHHRSPEGAAKDAARDSWLRAEGWLVFRVDDRNGAESLDEEVARVCEVLHSLCGPRRRWTAR